MPFLNLPFDQAPEYLYGTFAVEFAQIMKNDIENIYETKGKDLFLVIGPTGSGKSSFINRMLGYHFIKDEEGSYVINPDELNVDSVFAPMGNEDSVTTAAHLYTAGDTVWCDTPGFWGTDESHRSAEALSLYLAAKAAKTIRGIIVMVDFNALKVDRGEGFVKTLKRLHLLFGMSKKVRKSISLFFRGEEVTLEAIQKKLITIRNQQNLIVNKYKHAPPQDFEGNQKKQRAQQLYDFLSFIQRKKQFQAWSVLNPDSLDITSLEHPVSIEDLGLLPSDNERNDLKNWVLKLAENIHHQFTTHQEYQRLAQALRSYDERPATIQLEQENPLHTEMGQINEQIQALESKLATYQERAYCDDGITPEDVYTVSAPVKTEPARKLFARSTFICKHRSWTFLYNMLPSVILQNFWYDLSIRVPEHRRVTNFSEFRIITKDTVGNETVCRVTTESFRNNILELSNGSYYSTVFNQETGEIEGSYTYVGEDQPNFRAYVLVGAAQYNKKLIQTAQQDLQILREKQQELIRKLECYNASTPVQQQTMMQEITHITQQNLQEVQAAITGSLEVGQMVLYLMDILYKDMEVLPKLLAHYKAYYQLPDNEFSPIVKNLKTLHEVEVASQGQACWASFFWRWPVFNESQQRFLDQHTNSQQNITASIPGASILD